MQVPSASPGPLAAFAERFSNYLPTLAAGFFVLALGVAVGWVAKRAIVRILVWLRLDRLGGQAGWRAAFGKGDVRSAFYDMLGTLGMVVVVLVFLNNALEIWGLSVLSRMINQLIVYVPNLALVGLILGVGVLLANTVADRVEDALEEEGAPHGRLVARVFKAALLAVVGALALWQLSFAREIVLAAFLIAFGAIGVAFAIAVGLGSAKAIARGWESLFERRKEK